MVAISDRRALTRVSRSCSFGPSWRMIRSHTEKNDLIGIPWMERPGEGNRQPIVRLLDAARPGDGLRVVAVGDYVHRLLVVERDEQVAERTRRLS